jgi:hypothetical protein
MPKILNNLSLAESFFINKKTFRQGKIIENLGHLSTKWYRISTRSRTFHPRRLLAGQRAISLAALLIQYRMQF